MYTARACSEALQELIQPYTADGKHLVFDYHTETQVKARLAEVRDLRKELKILKSKIAEITQEIQETFIAKKAKIKAPMYLSLVSRKRANKYALKKQDGLYLKEAVTIEAYQAIIYRIDHLLSFLDETEHQITTDSVEKFNIRNVGFGGMNQ